MTAAARTRRHRERRCAGLVPLTTWHDEASIDALLFHHGKAPACGFDDSAKRNAAWQELVDELIAADAQQHYG
jgi:hypothetical protein